MATGTNHGKSGIKILDPIEGNTKWDGDIRVNFVDLNKPAEFLEFFNGTKLTAADPNDRMADNGKTVRLVQIGTNPDGSPIYQTIPGAWSDTFTDTFRFLAYKVNMDVSIVDDDIAAEFMVGDYVSNAGAFGFMESPRVGDSTRVGGFNWGVEDVGTIFGGVNFQPINPDLALPEETGGSNALRGTIVHEFAHGLGIAHPHDTARTSTDLTPVNAAGNPIGTAPYGRDQYALAAPYDIRYTTASYTNAPDPNEPDGQIPWATVYGMNATMMPLDLAVLHRMYDARANNTNDISKYELTDPRTKELDLDGEIQAIGRAFASIWDTGGVEDRIYYDGNKDYNAIINLNSATLDADTLPGDIAKLVADLTEVETKERIGDTAWAEMSQTDIVAAGFLTQLLFSDWTPVHVGYLLAADYNAFENNIEDALSDDGEDVLVGNELDNRLKSRGKDDILVGGLKDDEMHGGDKDDRLHGGDGLDSVRYDRWDWDDETLVLDRGVILKDFAKNEDLGIGTQFHHGPNAGFLGFFLGADSGTDTMIEVERVLTSKRADIVKVNDYLLNDLPNRVLFDLNRYYAEPIVKDNYDTVDFSEVTSGVSYYNGYVNAKSSDNKPIELSQAGKFEEVAKFVERLTGQTAEMQATAAGPGNFRVVGANAFIGTSSDDTFYFNYQDSEIPLFEKGGWWTETDSNGAPLFATVDAGAGNDIVVYNWGDVYNPGAVIPEGENGYNLPDGETTAGEELRVEIDGGEGTDRLFVGGGRGTIVAGGEGSDLLWTSAVKGQLWGGKKDGKGDGELDAFWFWPGTFIMDGEREDVVELFGIPLTGGTNLPIMGANAADILAFLSVIAQNSVAMDFTLPFIFYGRTESDQLLIYNKVYDEVGIGNVAIDGAPPVMVAENYDQGAYVDTDWAVPEPGDLSLTFRTFGPDGDQFLSISPFTLIWGSVITSVVAYEELAKSVNWNSDDDPLVLDLDGDGIETIGRFQSRVFFDMDGDYYAEQTGWIDSDDAFLVRDWNANGVIDDITEMFGAPGLRGFDELSWYDSNSDGVIDSADDIWSDLQLWRDFNQDGRSTQNELFTLGQMDVVSIDVAGATDLEDVTVFENTFAAQSSFTRGDGSTSEIAEILFDTNSAITVYRGERGLADWMQAAEAPDGKGIGSMPNLGVAMSYDPDLFRVVMEATAGMTTPDLADIREKATPIFGQWSQALSRTAELTPVLVDTTGVIVDHARYVEDATGGYFELASGNDILDAGGQVVLRPDMQDVLAHVDAGGASWRVEQLFSPQNRAEALQHREAAPYLVEIVDGRTVIVDYGVQQPDGSWQLASGTPVTDAFGAPVPAPTIEDITAQILPDTQMWRVEQLGHNPFANPEVPSIAINFIDGRVVDYSVEVTDADGAFHVWARNLDRALELQDKLGRAGDFQLRNFEIDFENLDELGSTDDSVYRVETVTAGQLHYANTLYGTEFQPQIMKADTDPDTGMISYSVGSFLPEDNVALGTVGDYDGVIIPAAIELMNLVMDSYVTTSRGFAARLALQTGLKPFAEELLYDPDADRFTAATEFELRPVFDAILAATPGEESAATAYLEGWHDILQVVYPDFSISPQDDFFAAAARKDQSFILANLIPAWEDQDPVLDLRGVMNAVGLQQEKLVDHTALDTQVMGTSGDDWIYLSEGDQTVQGGHGHDIYLIGQSFGHDVIDDVEEALVASPQPDELRFTGHVADELTATADGLDLVFTVNATGETLRIRDQFLGDLIDPLFGKNSPMTRALPRFPSQTAKCGACGHRL